MTASHEKTDRLASVLHRRSRPLPGRISNRRFADTEQVRDLLRPERDVERDLFSRRERRRGDRAIGYARGETRVGLAEPAAER